MPPTSSRPLNKFMANAGNFGGGQTAFPGGAAAAPLPARAPIGPNGFPGTGVNLGGAAKHNKWTDKVEKLSNCADNLVKKKLSKMIMDRLRHLNALELLALLFAIVAEFQDRMQGSCGSIILVSTKEPV